MIQPNSDCATFCYWLLNISWQKLSTSQRLIVESIQAAAIGPYPVSQQAWNNFNLFTAWRYPYYLVYADNSSFTAPNLLSGLIASWSFEGNSNDSLGAHNGSDTSILYSSSYGKVLEGASLVSSNSVITFSTISLTTSWSIAFWLYPLGSANSYAAIIGPASGSNFFYFRPSLNKIGVLTTADFVFNSNIPFTQWSCIVLSCSGGSMSMFVNGVLDSITIPYTNPLVLDQIGYNSATAFANAYLDILCIWNRPLSIQEARDYFASGVGIQYPF